MPFTTYVSANPPFSSKIKFKLRLAVYNYSINCSSIVPKIVILFSKPDRATLIGQMS